MKLTFALFSLLITLVFCSCSSSKKGDKNYLYFQDTTNNVQTVTLKETLIQPTNLLSIQVFSKSLSQQQAALFAIANNGGSETGGGQGGYQVDLNGNIELPLVGVVKAAGLTKSELQTQLTQKLQPFVKEPSVIIRYLEFKVNVLGDVQSPGSKNFATDQVTILDAIGAAGDLTLTGKRQDVKVIRQENGVSRFYTIDLRSNYLFQSPAYQLQQNDVVYVGANTKKLKDLGRNSSAEKNLQTGSIIISMLLSIVNTYLLVKNL